MKVFTFHLFGLGSNPGNTICWFSSLFVLSFLLVLWFSTLLKNQNFQFLFNLERTATFKQVLKNSQGLCGKTNYNQTLFFGNNFSFQSPDPKFMQINITGFLQAKNAREFMKELWTLLLSAQENIGGIPSSLLEKKKEEIKQRKVGAKLKNKYM